MAASSPHRDHVTVVDRRVRIFPSTDVTFREAVLAARRPIEKLNSFARHTPELATNLGDVLHDLDDRSRAVEYDPRAAEQIGRPGAKVGYTGLEALLSGRVERRDEAGRALRTKIAVGPGIHSHFGAPEWRILAGVELVGSAAGP